MNRKAFAPSIRFLALAIVISVLLLASCNRGGVDELFRKAEADLGIGKVGSALGIYNGMLSDFPNDPSRPKIFFKIAELYEIFLGDIDRAVESYGRVISEYPGSTWAASARELRASLEEGRGNFEAAIEDYTVLLKYASGDDIYKYRILLAGGYLASGTYSQARVELIPVIEAESVPMEYVANAIFMYAESFFLGGRPEEAIRWYDALIENFPDSDLVPEAKLHMATCFEETGRLGAARSVTEQSSDYPNQKVVDARMKSIDKKGLPIVQQKKKGNPPAKRK